MCMCSPLFSHPHRTAEFGGAAMSNRCSVLGGTSVVRGSSVNCGTSCGIISFLEKVVLEVFKASK